MIYRCASVYNYKTRCNNRGIKSSFVLSSVWACVKETLHTREYMHFNTQRASELQKQNTQIREMVTHKVNIVDELKIQSTSLISKIKLLNSNDLIAELEKDYNALLRQIKQREQEISDLIAHIAENNTEIQKSAEQKDFGQMEQSALYKEKLQKVVFHSITAMRGILEVCFKNGMIRYILIKKHRNGGAYLVPSTFEGDMEQKHIIVPSLQATHNEGVYNMGHIMRRYTFDEFFDAFASDLKDFEIPITSDFVAP